MEASTKAGTARLPPDSFRDILSIMSASVMMMMIDESVF